MVLVHLRAASRSVSRTRAQRCVAHPEPGLTDHSSGTRWPSWWYLQRGAASLLPVRCHSSAQQRVGGTTYDSSSARAAPHSRELEEVCQHPRCEELGDKIPATQHISSSSS